MFSEANLHNYGTTDAASCWLVVLFISLQQMEVIYSVLPGFLHFHVTIYTVD